MRLAALIAVLLSACATHPPLDTDAGVIIITWNGEPEYLVFVSQQGKRAIVDTDDCDPDCMTRLKRLMDAHDYDVVGLRSAKPDAFRTVGP